MEIPTLLILLCCSYHATASDEGYTIPVEHYETELQDLGEHVDIPETPVRVIKITKTVAVKIPVPYPVKVIEKVPYPVHINKPYPVPVPQIVKVPHVESPPKLQEHEALGHGGYQPFGGGALGDIYHVQDVPENAPHGHTNEGESQSYHGDDAGHQHSFAGNDYAGEGNSYDAPTHGYYGGAAGNDDADTYETKTYEQAIKDYLQKVNAGGNKGGLPQYKHN